MYPHWKRIYKNGIFILIYIAIIAQADEFNNSNESTYLCQDKICSCLNHTNEDSGLKYEEADCKSKNLNETYFENKELLSYLIKLDLHGNSISEIPNFNKNEMKILILSKNKIKILYDQNFKHSAQLEELDLSWNEIEVISMNAFDYLKMLLKLDLSHNNLKKINFLLFSHLSKLQDLNLSWNRNLNESKDLKSLDFFEFYGVTPYLRTLNLNGCNLEVLHLNRGTNLQNLYISNNNMYRMPELPRNIKLIDYSNNPIEFLNQTFASHLFYLHTLYLNDMPNLKSINEYAFFGLPALKTIYLQNCKELKYFDPHAFGESVIRNETDTVLQELNLRGSSLTTLSSSLKFVFENLKILNLDGAPLRCDCELQWIREYNFTVIGQCYEPKHLHMQQINKINEKFECDWPEHIKNIINGFIIFGILFVCITLISIVVLGLRKKRSHRRHIGSGSPYARITIEPTCENRF
ncbi:leucine-rich repeat-containing protein 4B [Condylostylus longicornis]|uniref:leucine-rich repeat-containing protein 4B n=1 Tax=Condylostylus longicornis TaxID=2530218 RepID=UPI00244DF2E7|nr:leucine-rich repeat-containing protein 4B [Condylostylus longicornis]XP_055380228.1 leucine-rich repeat-containing protein 4B [Condylostylus longicornis]